MPPPPPPPDLGLGTVPPLPLLAGARAASVPPRKARSSPRPPPGKAHFKHHSIDPGDALKLPHIDVSTPLLRAAAAGETGAANSAPAARADKPAAAPEPAVRPQRSATREPSTRIATQNAQDGAPVKATEKVAAPAPQRVPARGRALLEIAAGALLLYFGLYLDNTVLHGNATATWVGLHTVAFYAIGAGIAGLWP